MQGIVQRTAVRKVASSGLAATVAASTLLFSTRDSETKKNTNDNRGSVAINTQKWSKYQLKHLNFIPTAQQFGGFSSGPQCQCEALTSATPPGSVGLALKRRFTEKVLRQLATKKPVSDKYDILPTPLTDDEFGKMFLAVDPSTKEVVVLKRIPKSRLDDLSFLRELDALLRIRQNGGHANICCLRKVFDSDEENYELIFDLVSGGSLIDHLQKKPYSEANVATLIKEFVSALEFLHDIGIVHADIKLESLMLSSPDTNAVSKLVDCGCAKVVAGGKNDEGIIEHSTVAFLPPETFEKGSEEEIKPSMDMWAIGVILHILLTGVHPFDIYGEATDEILIRRIQSDAPVSLAGMAHTAHLSPPALDLLEKLLTKDPKKRITAKDVVRHSWIRGETSEKSIIEGSDKRLAQFCGLDFKLKGRYKDTALESNTKNAVKDDPFSGISRTVLENMKSLSFPEGDVIIREGEPGSSMFFVKQGSIKIESKEGFTARLGKGDTFGEGSLLNPNKARSATVTCVTPVEVVEISREFANKFLSRTDADFGRQLREMDKTRGLGRAKSAIFQNKEKLSELELKRSKNLFRKGDLGDAVYMLEQGQIDIVGQGGVVFSLATGDVFGEESLILKKRRNATAMCASDVCKLKSISAENFHALLEASPSTKEVLHDLAIQRDFQRAMALKMKTERVSFSNLDDAFGTIDAQGSGAINVKEARDMLSKLDTGLSEKEIGDALHSLDPNGSGVIELDDFKRIFVKSRVHNYPLQRRNDIRRRRR